MRYCNECHQNDEHMPDCPDDPRQDLAPVTAEDVKAAASSGYDVVGNMMEFECGTLGMRETLILFGHLIRTGMAWSLQGSYGRAASQLIDDGILSSEGVIDEARLEERRK